MARRKSSAFPGLSLDGTVEAVQEDFAKGLSHWLQLGPWQVGAANRALAASEGEHFVKALLSLTGPIGVMLASFIPDQAASPEDVARALVPLSLLSDVLALRDPEASGIEEVLVAMFADDIPASELDDLLGVVVRSSGRFVRLVQAASRPKFYLSLLLVYLDEAVAKKHLAAIGDSSRIVNEPLRFESYFLKVPSATVITPWIADAEDPPTIGTEALDAIFAFLRYYRRERRIREQQTSLGSSVSPASG